MPNVKPKFYPFVKITTLPFFQQNHLFLSPGAKMAHRPHQFSPLNSYGLVLLMVKSSWLVHKRSVQRNTAIVLPKTRYLQNHVTLLKIKASD